MSPINQVKASYSPKGETEDSVWRGAELFDMSEKPNKYATSPQGQYPRSKAGYSTLIVFIIVIGFVILLGIGTLVSWWVR